MSSASLPFVLLDPRGRCNRRGLAVAAGVLLVVQLLMGAVVMAGLVDLDHPVLLALKCLLMLAAMSAAVQRLHDLGMSGLRIPLAGVALFAWGLGVTWCVLQYMPLQAMQIGGTGFAIVTAAISLPMMAMLLWMHFAPGETRANRYGEVPSGLGFARRVHNNAQALSPA